MNRIPRFELHILPMIRTIDKERMIWWKDLHATETYYDTSGKPLMDNIWKIQKYLKGEGSRPVMPPVYYGGPWPDEWVSLFDRWVEEGCPRLSKASGRDYQADRENDNKVFLFGVVDAPSSGKSFEAWFSRNLNHPQQFFYEVWVEEHNDSKISSGEKELEMPVVNIGSDVKEIFVSDINGIHSIPINKQ
ncbi:MAG: hypothetical protein AAFQ94_29285 [Bacteroidota bacterium]